MGYPIHGNLYWSTLSLVKDVTTRLLRRLDFAHLSTSSFLTLSLQDTFEILRRQLRKNTDSRMVVLVVVLHFSHAYKAEEKTV